jgi:hypothetical protein
MVIGRGRRREHPNDTSEGGVTSGGFREGRAGRAPPLNAFFFFFTLLMFRKTNAKSTFENFHLQNVFILIFLHF